MNLKKIAILSGFVMVMLAAAQIVFAEEAQVAPLDQEAITSNQQSPAQKESDMQWAWGEVTNLDNQAKTITLKYLDYETDQEKELVLVVDEKTTFENIKDFNELKLNDTLSIDYSIAENSKNIAKNINFEKPEAAVLPEVESAMPVDSTMVVSESPVPVEPASAGPESTPTVAGQAQ